jgi:hypothetical protein
MQRQFFTVGVAVIGLFSLWTIVKAAGPFQLLAKGVPEPFFLVDENGQVLSGSTPVNVNLANSEPIPMKLIPSEEKVVSFYVSLPICNDSAGFFTVPANKSFILTNVEANVSVRLLASGDIRIDVYSSGGSSFAAGVPFGAGETVQACSITSVGNGRATLMGKLIPSS